MKMKSRQQVNITNFIDSNVRTATVYTAIPDNSSTAATSHTMSPPTPTCRRSTGSSDLKAAFGAGATLEAEVTWCLNTVDKHHSYSSNEDISDCFAAMFPDSQIAKTFSCGKDKTSYIVKFGLAPFFKQQLVTAVNNAGPFVLMFEESLNESTKTKQLYLHVRYWEGECVQSRYFGSQFMGHSRAEDLLEKIKVSRFLILTYVL